MRNHLISLAMLLLLPFGAHAGTYGEDFTPVELGCKSDACSLADWSTPYKFRTYDGNWSNQLILPTTSQLLSLDIASSATFTSSINSGSANSPKLSLSFTFGAFNMMSDIKLHTGDHFIFNRYAASNGYGWNPVGDSVYYMQPKRNGPYIPNTRRMVVFQMYNGYWSGDIYLPDRPMDDQIVIIHSDAFYSSKLHSSSNGPVIAGISQGQTLIYKYSGGSWKAVSWVPLGS